MTIDLSQYKEHEVVPIADLCVGDVWINKKRNYYYIVTEVLSLSNPQGLMEGYQIPSADHTFVWKGVLANNARILNEWAAKEDLDWVFMRKEVVNKIFVDELE